MTFRGTVHINYSKEIVLPVRFFSYFAYFHILKFLGLVKSSFSYDVSSFLAPVFSLVVFWCSYNRKKEFKILFQVLVFTHLLSFFLLTPILTACVESY